MFKSNRRRLRRVGAASLITLIVGSIFLNQFYSTEEWVPFVIVVFILVGLEATCFGLVVYNDNVGEGALGIGILIAAIGGVGLIVFTIAKIVQYFF